MKVLQCHLLKSKEWGTAFETLYGIKRATSWFPCCDCVTHGDACQGALGVHAGPWQQELVCLTPASSYLLPPPASRRHHAIVTHPILSVTQVHVIYLFLICFLLAMYVHVGIQAQISHTAFL